MPLSHRVDHSDRFLCDKLQKSDETICMLGFCIFYFVHMKKLSIRQKILIGLVVVGLAAVVRDRFQDAAPVAVAQGHTDSSPVAVPVAAHVAAPASAPVAASAAAQRDPLDLPCKKAMVDRLDACVALAGDSGQTRDAFCPPQAWMPSKPAQAETVAPSAPGSSFVSSHSLQGILISGPSKDVIINNRCVSVGQTIDGFKLVRVEDSRAVLVSNIDDSVKVELVQKTNLQSE